MLQFNTYGYVWKLSAYILSVHVTNLKTDDTIKLILCFEVTNSLLKKS